MESKKIKIDKESEREKFNNLLKTYKNQDFKYYTFFSQLHELFKKMCEVRENKYGEKAAKKSDFYKNVISNISMKGGESDFNLKEILKKKYSIWCAFKKKHRQAIKQIANEYADKLNDLFYNIYKLNEAIYNKIDENKRNPDYINILKKYNDEKSNNKIKIINLGKEDFFYRPFSCKDKKDKLDTNITNHTENQHKININTNTIPMLFPTSNYLLQLEDAYKYLESEGKEGSINSYTNCWFFSIASAKSDWRWNFKNLILPKRIYVLKSARFLKNSGDSLGLEKNNAFEYPFNESKSKDTNN